MLALVLESRFWSLLCLRWKWCWRLCLGRGRRRARIGTCVEVLDAAVIVLELVLVPAFRSWSPCRRCARVGTCVEVLVAVVLVLELCWYLRLGRVVGVGVPGLPPRGSQDCGSKIFHKPFLPCCCGW